MSYLKKSGKVAKYTLGGVLCAGVCGGIAGAFGIVAAQFINDGINVPELRKSLQDPIVQEYQGIKRMNLETLAQTDPVQYESYQIRMDELKTMPQVAQYHTALKNEAAHDLRWRRGFALAGAIGGGIFGAGAFIYGIAEDRTNRKETEISVKRKNIQEEK